MCIDFHLSKTLVFHLIYWSVLDIFHSGFYHIVRTIVLYLKKVYVLDLNFAACIFDEMEMPMGMRTPMGMGLYIFT